MLWFLCWTVYFFNKLILYGSGTVYFLKMLKKNANVSDKLKYLIESIYNNQVLIISSFI